MKVYVVSHFYQPYEGNGTWSARVERVFTNKDYAEAFCSKGVGVDEDGYYDIDELELEGDFKLS